MPRPPARKSARSRAGKSKPDWPSAVSKALAHPDRVEILRRLDAVGQSSPSAIAIESSGNLGRVSYHVRELNAAGLLRRSGGRMVRGAVENFYELTDHGRAALKAVNTVLELDPGGTTPRGSKRRGRSS